MRLNKIELEYDDRMFVAACHVTTGTDHKEIQIIITTDMRDELIVDDYVPKPDNYMEEQLAKRLCEAVVDFVDRTIDMYGVQRSDMR